MSGLAGIDTDRYCQYIHNRPTWARKTC